jgi:hypothetical protein
MSAPEKQRPDDAPINPEDLEAEEPISLFSEFVWFLRDNKKWWLIPLVGAFLLLATIIVLSSNPVTAPFIYSFF